MQNNNRYVILLKDAINNEEHLWDIQKESIDSILRKIKEDASDGELIECFLFSRESLSTKSTFIQDTAGVLISVMASYGFYQITNPHSPLLFFLATIITIIASSIAFRLLNSGALKSKRSHHYVFDSLLFIAQLKKIDLP